MSFPCALRLVQELDDDPRYRGSIHDDAVARAQGFPAALAPGAFVYGHVSRLALRVWGENWLACGALSTRFRRPVFRGDALTVAAQPPEPTDGMLRAAVAVTNAQGETVAEGWIATPAGAPPAPPELAALPPLADVEPTAVERGALVVGAPLGSIPRALTAEMVARSRAAFAEAEPIYAERGLAHSGCLMRLAMGDTNAHFRFPAPVILTEAAAQHFAPVRVGQRIETRGRIAEVWERNGRHYFASEEWMLADGAVAAAFRRTTIYG